jgi:hypothetical protein
MERKTPLEERLAEVEKQIVDVADKLARQQEIVQELERAERDAGPAKHRLNNFLQMQIALAEKRDHILQEIALGDAGGD